MSAGDYSIGSENWPGLAKVMEECGEVIQVAGKIIAADGRAIRWNMDETADSPSPLTERLADEVADTHAALLFLIETNHLDTDRINARANRKLAMFRQWHADNRDPSGVVPS
jgi:non-ribosomal peptide synthetase component F